MYIQYALQIERAEYMQRPAYSTIIVRPLSSSSRPSRRVKIPSATYTTIGNIILSLSLSLVSLIHYRSFDSPSPSWLLPDAAIWLFKFRILMYRLCRVYRHSREKRAFFPCRFFFLFRIFFFPQRHTRLASLNDNFLFFFCLSIFLFLWPIFFSSWLWRASAGRWNRRPKGSLYRRAFALVRVSLLL